MEFSRKGTKELPVVMKIFYILFWGSNYMDGHSY